MPVISEISDDPKYTIKTVSARTGIRSVTLRAWERRYEVLNPQRADNRYRQYSDRDIEILRWLKDRVDNGIPISAAASELKKMAKKGEWADIIPSGVVPQSGQPAWPAQYYAEQLYRVLLKHDEMRAGEPVSYTHLRAHETVLDLVCRLLLEKKKTLQKKNKILQTNHTST